MHCTSNFYATKTFLDYSTSYDQIWQTLVYVQMDGKAPLHMLELTCLKSVLLTEGLQLVQHYDCKTTIHTDSVLPGNSNVEHVML